MIVIDTHVLIWWLDRPEKLSTSAQKAIERSSKEREIIISTISTWEIYLLIKRKKLTLSQEVDTWVQNVENLRSVFFVPIDNLIASKSVQLPEPIHKDPADRIIIATALINGAPLITNDRRILKYPHVQTIW